MSFFTFLIGIRLVQSAYVATALHTDIPATWKYPPMQPILGFATGILLCVASLVLFLRWLYLSRKPKS